MFTCFKCGTRFKSFTNSQAHDKICKPFQVAEEPSYMMFARSNVRDGLMSTPSVVEALLARIDRLEGKN